MLSETEIQHELHRIGFKDNEIPIVIADVAKVFLSHVFRNATEDLPDEEKRRLLALQPEELKRYIPEHKELFKQLTNDDFEQLHDRVWNDYFKAMQ